MKYSIVLAALAAAVSAHYNSTSEEMVTSTIFSTHTFTITSCAPAVKSCPAESTITKVVTVPAYTTVCPATQTPSSVPVYKPSAKPVPVYSSSTTTAVPVYTVSSSAPVTYTATNTPKAPGSTPSAPVYTISTSNAASAPPAGSGTGTIGTGTGTIGTIIPPTTTSAPIATGAAYKVGAGSFGAVAVAAAAMML